MEKTILCLFILLIAVTWVTPTGAQQTINNCPIPYDLRIIKPDNEKIPPKLALLSGIWEGNWGRMLALFIVVKIEENEAIVINAYSGGPEVVPAYWGKKCPIEKGEDGNYTIIMEQANAVTNRLIQTNDPNSIRVFRLGTGKWGTLHADAIDSIFRRKELTLPSQQSGTPAEARKMVGEAIAYIKSNGKEKAFAEINNPKGKFVGKGMYVVVFDMNGTCLASGAYPNSIGKNLTGIKDPDGRPYIKELIETAKTQGSGWQDYKSRNYVSIISAYFEKYEDIIVCLAGAVKALNP